MSLEVLEKLEAKVQMAVDTISLLQMEVEELKEQLTNLLRDQFNLRMQKGTGQLTQTHLLKQVRRDIARVNTLLNEKAGN